MCSGQACRALSGAQPEPVSRLEALRQRLDSDDAAGMIDFSDKQTGAIEIHSAERAPVRQRKRTPRPNWLKVKVFDI